MKKNFTKVFAVLLALVTLLSALPAGAAASTPAFEDIAGHWAEGAVSRWAGRKVVQGYEGLVRPDDPITRAEAAATLNRVFGYQKLSDISFKDVPAGAWYREDILKLHAAEVMLGDGDGFVRPEANIIREEAAALLLRAFGLEVGDTLVSFTDDGDISPWARPGVGAMAEQGYIHGYANGDGTYRFEPGSDITRAEYLTLLDNMVAAYYDEAKIYENENVNGNAILRVDGAGLKDAAVSGTLYVAEGVGEGDVRLENVKAGRLVIRGGGVNSIYINGNFSAGGFAVTESALPVALKFPIARSAEVREYFKDAAGAVITDQDPYCVVTFGAAWTRSLPFELTGASNPSGPPPVAAPRDSSILSVSNDFVQEPGSWCKPGITADEKLSMQPHYELSDKTITASGYLAKVENLSYGSHRFPLGINEPPGPSPKSVNGYFAAVNLRIDADAHSALKNHNSTQGAVMTLTRSDRQWNYETTPTEASFLPLTEENGPYFIEFLLYVRPEDTSAASENYSYTLELDFDGDGSAYKPVTYQIDFNGVELLTDSQDKYVQTISLKENANHDPAGISYEAANPQTGPAQNTLTLDAKALEDNTQDISSLISNKELTAAMVFDKPSGITTNAATVELFIDGVSKGSQSLTGQSFVYSFPLCGAETGYTYDPNKSWDIEIVWKGNLGTVLGVSAAKLYRDTLFTVTYDYQGSNTDTKGNTKATQTVSYGDKAVSIAPVLEGKQQMVVGWYQDAACTNAFNFDTLITANRTLFAKWGVPEEIQTLITNNLTGGYELDLEEMKVIPRGKLTVKGNMTVPEGLTVVFTEAVTSLAISRDPVLNFNGVLVLKSVNDKLLLNSLVSIASVATSSATINFGDTGGIIDDQKNKSEAIVAGENNDDYKGSAELLTSAGTSAKIDGVNIFERNTFSLLKTDFLDPKISVNTYIVSGDLTVNEAGEDADLFKLDDSFNLTVEEGVTVTLLRDMLLQGKLTLKGKIISQGGQILPDANDAKVQIVNAGQDLTAFGLQGQVSTAGMTLVCLTTPDGSGRRWGPALNPIS